MVLDNQGKIWLEQEAHFEEIYIWLKRIFEKHNPNHFADLKEQIEEIKEEKTSESKRTGFASEGEKLDKEQKHRLKKLDKEFENPLKEMFEED